MKLHVGGLAYSVTDDELKDFFAEVGEVKSAVIIKDKFNDYRSKGFGFVEFENADDAKAAIDKLSGQELKGRAIVVNEAIEKPREDRGSRGGGRDNNRGGRAGGFNSFRQRY